MSTNIKLEVRKYNIKKNDGYTVPSKGLIKSWRITDKTLKFIPLLIIDDHRIRGVPREDKFFIDIKEIREYIRDPNREPDEYNLDNFESIMYINQLYALEFYESLSSKDLFSSLFTRDYKKIQLYFGVNGPDEVEIEEEFWDRNKFKESENGLDLTEEDKEFQQEIVDQNIKPIDRQSMSMI